MSRQSIVNRLGRLEATVLNQNQMASDDLLRVAGKTQEQAEADLLEWFRQLLAPVNCSAYEREVSLRQIAESNWEFADKLRGFFPALPDGRKPNVSRAAD